MSTEITIPSNDEKNIATITHLGGTVFLFVPSLIVWLLKKEDSAYIADQAKEALNFQIVIAGALFISSAILTWILVGFFTTPIIWLLNIIFCIIAAVATSKGEQYRYPFTIRLIN
jgi:uncharacterized protein